MPVKSFTEQRPEQQQQQQLQHHMWLEKLTCVSILLLDQKKSIRNSFKKN
jgi:hypothetical protein